MGQTTTSLRQAAVQIVRVLRRSGHTTYLAGGCVRDALLGIEPKDYDVATDANPQTVRKIFPRSRFVGESFGVVLVEAGGYPIEVATFRSEWGYHDGRRPDHLIFTDAEHDAQRRDLTINGLFADPLADPDALYCADSGQASPVESRGGTRGESGGEGGPDRIIDFVDGRADLEARVIRAIGDPDQRFGEDYLRMLRAVRFAARLDFKIEPRTAAAIRKLSKGLGQISRQRIGQETQWMLGGPRRGAAVRLLQQLGLDGAMLNEEGCTAPPAAVDRLSDEADYGTALAAWMFDRHAPDAAAWHQSLRRCGTSFPQVACFVEGQAEAIIRRWRDALCLSNEDRGALSRVLTLGAQTSRWSQLGVARRKRLLAAAGWNQTLLLLRALGLGDPVTEIKRQAAPLVAEGVAPPPLVDGHDLIEMGMAPGPEIGRLLEQVYSAQLEGRVAHRREALAWLAKHRSDRA